MSLIINNPTNTISLNGTSAREDLAPGHIYGCNVTGNNATQTATVAVGSARSDADDANIKVTSPLTCTMTTTGENGRDAGSAVNGVWHIYVIRKSSDGTVGCLASLSSTSPTMPSGYDQKRRVGALTYISSAVVGTVQYGYGSVRSTNYTSSISQFNSTTGGFTFNWSAYVPSTAHLMHSGFHWYSAANVSYDNQASMNSSPWTSGFYIDNSGYAIARGGPVPTIPLIQGGTRVVTFTRTGTGTHGIYQYCYGYEESV